MKCYRLQEAKEKQQLNSTRGPRKEKIHKRKNKFMEEQMEFE